MPASLASQIIRLREHFAQEFPSQKWELDWICFSSLPPALIAQGGISLKAWYHAVRQKLSRAEYGWD